MSIGVYQACKKNGSIYYRASLTYHSKHISLGSADDEVTADALYQEGMRILSDAGITIDNYIFHIHHLSFEKAISLLNYRDHGIYIKTPIYLQNGFFSYYLKPDYNLKFDNDDLFYYSSHKIICRGNHLFVNDYGMQYNIANRYGIKNYAVQNRDYLFVNGDASDYRYANIRILNTYHGITQTFKNGKCYFLAKMHLNGDVIIGRYSSETKAAIAYNKAVDYARDHGIQKNFIENYIPDLSAREYADLYASLHLSQTYLDYIDHFPVTQNKKI